MLNISGITDGIVLDHISAGHAMNIYNYLELGKSGCCVAVITNAKSNKMGKKDIIKIEGELDVDINILRILDNNITINRIENGKIADKITPVLPDTISNILKCRNPRCITTSGEQGIVHKFCLTHRENAVYRCFYCEQQFDRKQLSD